MKSEPDPLKYIFQKRLPGSLDQAFLEGASEKRYRLPNTVTMSCFGSETNIYKVDILTVYDV